MPKKLKNDKIRCRYFTWRIYRRPNGTYYADGRMKNEQPDLGRHSLGTNDHDEALCGLEKLDLAKAVEHGRADPSAITAPKQRALPLGEGVGVYKAYVKRPAVAGGSPKSWKRYRAVFNKFTKFLENAGVDTWQQVGKSQLNQYAGWLEDHDYAYATQYLELTTIKQSLNVLVEQHLLPKSALFKYPLSKPGETTTYCYTTEQVNAMVRHCEKRVCLSWLAPVLIGLAHTGLRISELADLRWSDLDDDREFLSLPDHSRRGTKNQRTNARTTKGRRGRVVPVHPRLKDALEHIPRHRDGRIFHGPRKGTLKPDTVCRILIRDVLEPLASKFPRVGDELAFEDGRIHSFRHYFCSACANSNVPD